MSRSRYGIPLNESSVELPIIAEDPESVEPPESHTSRRNERRNRGAQRRTQATRSQLPNRYYREASRYGRTAQAKGQHPGSQASESTQSNSKPKQRRRRHVPQHDNGRLVELLMSAEEVDEAMRKQEREHEAQLPRHLRFFAKSEQKHKKKMPEFYSCVESSIAGGRAAMVRRAAAAMRVAPLRWHLLDGLGPQHNEVCIAILMYNEPWEQLAMTLASIAQNVSVLCTLRGSDRAWRGISVWIVMDGMRNADPGTMKALDYMGILDLGTLAKHIDAVDGGDGADTRNVQRLHVFESRVRFQRVVELPTDKAVTEQVHKAATTPKNASANFEHTVASDSGKTKRTYLTYAPLNLCVALKERNGGKLDSHIWMYDVVCAGIHPSAIINFDVGTFTDPTALVSLVENFRQRDSRDGGRVACASTLIMPDALAERSALGRFQIWEYAAGFFLKGVEHVAGLTPVAPGAFSAFRWSALAEQRDAYLRSAQANTYATGFIHMENSFLSGVDGTLGRDPFFDTEENEAQLPAAVVRHVNSSSGDDEESSERGGATGDMSDDSSDDSSDVSTVEHVQVRLELSHDDFSTMGRSFDQSNKDGGSDSVTDGITDGGTDDVTDGVTDNVTDGVTDDGVTDGVANDVNDSGASSANSNGNSEVDSGNFSFDQIALDFGTTIDDVADNSLYVEDRLTDTDQESGHAVVSSSTVTPGDVLKQLAPVDQRLDRTDNTLRAQRRQDNLRKQKLRYHLRGGPIKTPLPHELAMSRIGTIGTLVREEEMHSVRMTPHKFDDCRFFLVDGQLLVLNESHAILPRFHVRYTLAGQGDKEKKFLQHLRECGLKVEALDDVADYQEAQDRAALVVPNRVAQVAEGAARPLEQFYVLARALPSMWSRNLGMAEDRLLPLTIVTRAARGSHCSFLAHAAAYTDVPGSLAVFLRQRRRWNNGSIVAMVWSLARLYLLWRWPRRQDEGDITEARCMQPFRRRVLMSLVLIQSQLVTLMSVLSGMIMLSMMGGVVAPGIADLLMGRWTPPSSPLVESADTVSYLQAWNRVYADWSDNGRLDDSASVASDKSELMRTVPLLASLVCVLVSHVFWISHLLLCALGDVKKRWVIRLHVLAWTVFTLFGVLVALFSARAMWPLDGVAMGQDVRAWHVLLLMLPFVCVNVLSPVFVVRAAGNLRRDSMLSLVLQSIVMRLFVMQGWTLVSTSFSIAKLDDISWGTKAQTASAEQRLERLRRILTAQKWTWLLLFIVLCSGCSLVLGSVMSPLSAVLAVVLAPSLFNSLPTFISAFAWTHQLRCSRHTMLRRRVRAALDMATRQDRELLERARKRLNHRLSVHTLIRLIRCKMMLN
ncbi:MAG: hypothetical protein MHM6MM_003533 [Cercozoa sp. M6MM]